MKQGQMAKKGLTWKSEKILSPTLSRSKMRRFTDAIAIICFVLGCVHSQIKPFERKEDKISDRWHIGARITRVVWSLEVPSLENFEKNASTKQLHKRQSGHPVKSRLANRWLNELLPFSFHSLFFFSKIG